MRLSDSAIIYAENHGIYEIYRETGNAIIYYSYYSEGFYRVTKNLKTGKETRQLLKYKKTPKFLIGEYGNRYNYFCG